MTGCAGVICWPPRRIHKRHKSTARASRIRCWDFSWRQATSAPVSCLACRNEGVSNAIHSLPTMQGESPAVQRSAETAGPVPTLHQNRHIGVSKLAWLGGARRPSISAPLAASACQCRVVMSCRDCKLHISKRPGRKLASSLHQVVRRQASVGRIYAACTHHRAQGDSGRRAVT